MGGIKLWKNFEADIIESSFEPRSPGDFFVFRFPLFLPGRGMINVLYLEILPYDFLLDNEAKHAQNTKHFNNRIRSDKALT